MLESNRSPDPSPPHSQRAPAKPKRPPLVAGYPLVGLVPSLLRDSLGTVTAATKKHGEMVRLRIGPTEAYLFAHPDHAQHILEEKSKVYTKEGSLWEAAQTLVGRGIGNTDGEGWLKNRRAMQPQFQRSRIADLTVIMAKETRRLLDELQREVAAGRRTLSLFAEIRRMVSMVFFKTMFDTSIDGGDMEKLLKAMRESFSSVDTLLWTSFLPSWMPVPGLRKYQAAVSALDAIVYRVIQERLDHPAERDDLLNLLMKSLDVKSGDADGKRQLRDEVATMIVATQDGPSLMLAWGLTELARHPDADATLRREVADKVGERDAGLEHAHSLAYTKGVLEESLRLYPPLWLTFRLATEEDVIDGCRIPKGAMVLLCPYLTHRNAAFWESPDTFDPSRFTRPGGAPSHRGAYLPFGLGAHLCIGKHIGLLFGQIFMAEFVKRFTLRLPPDARIQPKGMVSLQPAHEVMVELETRP